MWPTYTCTHTDQTYLSQLIYTKPHRHRIYRISFEYPFNKYNCSSLFRSRKNGHIKAHTHTLEIRYWLTEMVAHFDVRVSRFTRFRIKFHVIVYTFREYFEHKIQCKTSLWPKAYISGLAFIYQSEIQ